MPGAASDSSEPVVWDLGFEARRRTSETLRELYQAEDCPYCERVCEKLMVMDLSVSYVNHNPRTAEGDVRNAQTLAEMESIGGQDQVPFLVDHERGTSASAVSAARGDERGAEHGDAARRDDEHRRQGWDDTGHTQSEPGKCDSHDDRECGERMTKPTYKASLLWLQ